MAIEQVNRKSKKVKEAAIESKDQRWHCRNRVTLVFGSNDIEELDTYLYSDKGVEFQTVQFHQAKSKAIEEILDNCIDEFYRNHVTEVAVTLDDDGKTVTVEDNGIGFPVEKAQVVYTEFRTGSKFKDEEVDEKGFLHRTLGQNGLGASATCLTSDLFEVTIRHYNSKKTQTYTFIDGALKVKKTKPKPFKGHSGVKVTFVLAKEVYKDNTVDKDLLRKRIIDLAYNNPGLSFKFNGEKFLFKKGLYELAQMVSPDHAQQIGEGQYVRAGENSKGKKVKSQFDISFSLCIDPDSDERERFISFVNSTPTFDGGFHHDRVKRIFINTLKDKLERAAKKEKISFVDNDFLAGLTFVIGIIMPNPRFESQTKRKLVRDYDLEKCIEEFMSKNMDKFMKKNKDFMESIVERAKSRQRLSAIAEAAKKGRKAKKKRIEKLLDANERKDRSDCTLFICEGDSAIGGLRSSRNKLTQGGIALRGKPMNVSQSSIKEVVENQEFSDIMASVGITIGQEPELDKMRFSRIVFLADSDVDGGHINTLLTNFFFTFWPQLFEQGVIQIAKAPLFEVVTDKKTIYAETPEELESIKKKADVKIKEIQRNKGLGEMSPEAWKYVMGREEYTKITIADVKEAKRMLVTCFGKDSQLRKDLLIDHDDSMVAMGTDAVQKSLLKNVDTKKSSKKLAAKTATKSNKKVAKKTAKKVAKKTAKKTAKKRKA